MARCSLWGMLTGLSSAQGFSIDAPGSRLGGGTEKGLGLAATQPTGSPYPSPPMSEVTPVDLRRTARAIAANYGDKGAVVITVSDEGVRIGTEGLSPDELRYALCVATHYSFMFEEMET